MTREASPRVAASDAAHGCQPLCGEVCRAELTTDSDFTIVAQYANVYRGVVQYYRLASNLSALHRLRWTLQQSLLKTLANKHHASVGQICRRYKTTIQTERGPRTAFQATVHREGRTPLVATWGQRC